MIQRIELRKLAAEMIGRPADKVFQLDETFAWANVSQEIAFKLQELGSNHPTDSVTIFATYAYPDRVPGGQTYSVHIHS